MKKSIMQINLKYKFLKILILFLLIFTAVLLFISPKKYITSISLGLSVWSVAVLPALLPFFIITKSLTALNIIPYKNRIFKAIAKIFKVPECGIYIFLMSIISGYPVGAKLIEEFYQKGAINSTQATKLVAICSTSGPLFIVGTVGVMFMGSVKIGFILLISHILGAIFNGLLYRNRITKDTSYNNFDTHSNKSENVLYDIMMNSILSVLLVGSYIAIFFMIIEMLKTTNILEPLNFLLQNILSLLNLPSTISSSIINGFIEITNGCQSLSLTNISSLKKVVIASLLIGFGGCCVHMQSLTFYLSCKVNLKFYFLSKITQSIFSGFCAYILMLIFIIH